jgi:hypothetical protein
LHAGAGSGDVLEQVASGSEAMTYEQIFADLLFSHPPPRTCGRALKLFKTNQPSNLLSEGWFIVCDFGRIVAPEIRIKQRVVAIAGLTEERFRVTRGNRS